MHCEDRFLEIYHRAPEALAFCPYRVCPVGAHSDANLGKITGLAIDKGIHIAYSPKLNGVVELCSLQFGKRAQWHVRDIPRYKRNDWADYLRGATLKLSERYPLTTGISGVIEGSLPIGGLSSSAAVVLVYLKAICDVNNIHPEPLELIQMSVGAENDYVGVNSGKLDQSCEVFSKKDHLLYLDTKTDKYELIPFGSAAASPSPSLSPSLIANHSSLIANHSSLSSSPSLITNHSSLIANHSSLSSSSSLIANRSSLPFSIAIFFSGVERTLAGSKFNMRVDEARSAAYALQAYAGIEYGKFQDANLRNVPREVFEQYRDRLPENWAKRAEHWYTEFARVEAAAEAWRRGDIVEYGRLSTESGWSSIYNWETGSPELKTLYDIMCHTEGIYGGRFSGAGFKGCCMALIDPAYEESIREQVTKEYLAAFPELTGRFSIHICHSADGIIESPTPSLPEGEGDCK